MNEEDEIRSLANDVMHVRAELTILALLIRQGVLPKPLVVEAVKKLIEEAPPESDLAGMYRAGLAEII